MKVLESAPTPAASLSEKTGEWNRYLEMVIKAVLWIYVASLPFRALLVVERNGFLILLALLLLWSLSSRRLFYSPTPIDIPLLAFVGWVAFTIPFAQFPAYSLKEFGKLLQGLLIFYAVFYFLHDATNRKNLVRLMVGTTSIMSLYGLYQYNPIEQQAMRSFLPSEVWLTTYLVLLVPLCFGAAYGEKRPWLCGLAIAIGISAVVCLVLTRSRAGSVALFVELVLLAWCLRRWKGAVLAVLSTLVLIGGLWLLTLAAPSRTIDEVIPMNKNVGSIIHRFDIWNFTLAEIQKHPVVGIGYGKDNFLMVYGERPEEIERPHAAVNKAGVHNILLYHALHVGIPGAILFVWLMIRTVQALLLGAKASSDHYSYGILIGILVGVVGMIIRCQFDFMLVGTLAVLFWALLAIGMTPLPHQERFSVAGVTRRG